VPFSQTLQLMLCAKQHVWEFLMNEGVVDRPVELWSELELSLLLRHFYDCALYHTAVGYENAGVTVHAGAAA
jgi:hypothetical protein